MTDLRNSCKNTLLKENDLSSKNCSNILCLPDASQSKFSLSDSKVGKKTCTSIEIESSLYEEYILEYSTYLLRKAQNKLLAWNKSSKEENVKKCFVSLKQEFEELLNKYLKLNKEFTCFKIYFDLMREASKKIQDGKKLLEGLKEGKFENLLKTLSCSLDNVINQLHSIDIDKKLIEEMFEKNIWGSGCVLEACLIKIDACISENKCLISNIAEELNKVRQLWMENLIFKEKFTSLFKSISVQVLETNYDTCINAVKKAFIKRNNDSGNLDLEFNIPAIDQFNKIQHLQHSLELSKLESFVIPRDSSTPQPKVDKN